MKPWFPSLKSLPGPCESDFEIIHPRELQFTRIKDVGIAIGHLRGRILFYTAAYGNGLEGVAGHGPKKLTLRKRHFFVIEKHIEDVKQDQKTVPTLVESIMRPTDLVKEKLRRILFKLSQYRPEIIKIRVSTFWKIDEFPPEANTALSPSKF